MHLKLIKSENDYEEALVRVVDLLSAEAGTPEFDELEVLSRLIEDYEEQVHPIALPDPIEAIKFRMEQAGLKQRDLVPYIGSASKVSEVLSRKRPLTLAMMKGLHTGLGIPAEVFLQGEVGPGIQQPLEADRLPWGEIIRRGWIQGFSGTVREAKSRAEEFVSLLFPLTAGNCLRPALYRRAIRSDGTMDEHAITAWTARITALACAEELSTRYRPGSIDATFVAGLAKLSFMEDGPRLAKEYLGKHGIHLVLEKHFPRTRVDGAATLLPDGTPVIGLSLRYDRLDNFWFCIFHELAHVALHLGNEGAEWFIDDLESQGDDKEAEADAWARDSLIPPAAWSDTDGLRSEADVRAFAAKLSISPSIIAGRLRWERKNYRLLTDLVGQGQVRRHFADC